MTEIIGQHFIVSGRVQGVCFRGFTKQQAIALGLTGWVRNLPDGQVEAKAFGTPEQLIAFADKLRAGPAMARVSAVTLEEIPLESHADFIVR
jgi:acylphosphatase